MYSGRGYMLSDLQVTGCGHTEEEFRCWYRYKDEYEPEANKTKYPNKEDRQYEDYMFLSTITEAKRNGVDVDTRTYQSDRLEWNEELQKFIIQKHVFNNEEDYYKQLQ